MLINPLINQLIKLISSVASLSVVMLFSSPASAGLIIIPFNALRINSDAGDSSGVTSMNSLSSLSNNNGMPNSNTSNSRESAYFSPFVSGQGSGNQSNNNANGENSRTETAATGTAATGTAATGTAATETAATETAATETAATETAATGTVATETAATGTVATGSSTPSLTGASNTSTPTKTTPQESQIADLTTLASMLEDLAGDNSNLLLNVPDINVPDSKDPKLLEDDPASIPEPTSIVAITVIGVVGLLTKQNQKTHK